MDLVSVRVKYSEEKYPLNPGIFDGDRSSGAQNDA